MKLSFATLGCPHWTLLRSSGYEGYLSFEWEKKWEPSLEEPETAFPHYVRFVRDLLKPTP